EGLSTVGRAPERDVVDVHDVGVDRVDGDTRVVGRPIEQPARLVRHPLPGPAVVIATVEPALLTGRLDQRVPAARHGLRDVDADLADEAPRQTVRELRPGVAAVRGLPEAALFRATDDRPRLALTAPRRRVDLVRVRRIHREIDEAGRV